MTFTAERNEQITLSGPPERWIRRPEPFGLDIRPAGEAFESPIRLPLKRRQRKICGIDIPSALENIAQVVEESRWMLDLPNNWDDEGSPGYARSTWERAVRFLIQNAILLWQEYGVQVTAPAVHNGPEGSIDIYWKSEHKNLLINIPADPDVLADYYGEDSKGHKVKGTLDTSHPKQWLLMWQME